MTATEIIFEFSEDELDGGYATSAPGFGIHPQGDSMGDLRRNVREAVDCHFEDDAGLPCMSLDLLDQPLFIACTCTASTKPPP